MKTTQPHLDEESYKKGWNEAIDKQIKHLTVHWGDDPTTMVNELNSLKK